MPAANLKRHTHLLRQDERAKAQTGHLWPAPLGSILSPKRAGLPSLPAHGAGMTLVEMVVAITLLAILGSVTAVFMLRPIQGYTDLARRAALVEAAESALRRQARDVRLALPRSVRIQNLAGGYAVEVLPTIEGAMYRRRDTFPGGGTTTANRLQIGFGNDADGFDIHMFFRHITVPSSSTTHRLVINNVGGSAAATNVYLATGATQQVITPLGTTIGYSATGVNGAHNITMTPAYRFNSYSSTQRIYVVETPVSYLCAANATDPVAGTLTRYYNYPITASQPTTAAAFTALNASSALVTDRVSACSLTTTTGDLRTRALATFTLTLAEEGEEVRLVHQVMVDNSP